MSAAMTSGTLWISETARTIAEMGSGNVLVGNGESAAGWKRALGSSGNSLFFIMRCCLYDRGRTKSAPIFNGVGSTRPSSATFSKVIFSDVPESVRLRGKSGAGWEGDG